MTEGQWSNPLPYFLSRVNIDDLLSSLDKAISMKYCTVRFSFLLLSLSLVSCSRVSSAAAEAKPSTAPDAVAHSREADDVARFLAGMPGKQGSPFIKLESGEEWKQHREALDSAWQKADAELLSGVRQFQSEELSSAPMRQGPVFYPFAGPDSLMATQYFPHSPVYVMVALEPAGTLPSEEQIESKDLTNYLDATRSTVASVLGRSFFITRQMDRQFRGQVTDGLLLPILELLVRTNNTVLGFRYIRLDENGKIIDRTLDYHATTRYGNKGVQIEFRRESDQSIHELYYFSVNLADERLIENKPFQEFATNLKGATTLLKATSYMTHHKNFSLIRKIVLAESAAVLQDDSGIPFRLFGNEDWKLQLYGDYDKPYGSFSWIEQADLRSAYKLPGIKPLPMHVGYGYRRITSNLLLAKRLSITPAAETKAQ